MPLQSYNAIEIALATGARGSTGLVTDPILSENAAPGGFFVEIPLTETDYGNSGTYTTLPTYSEMSISDSIMGLLHPNALSRVFSAFNGIVTASAEGTAYKYTWSTCGTPLEVCVLKRYSTASASTQTRTKGYLSQIAIDSSKKNGWLSYTLGYTSALMTNGVANPTLTVPTDIDTDGLRFSNKSPYTTVFTFTPTGGSLDDLTERATNINVALNRGVNGRPAPIKTFPFAGLPDYNALGKATITFNNQDEGGVSTPQYTDQAYAYGAATGTLPANPNTPIDGVFDLKFIGGVTAADATKYYTLELTGNCIYRGTETETGDFSGSLVLTQWPTLSLICDVASVARPT